MFFGVLLFGAHMECGKSKDIYRISYTDWKHTQVWSVCLRSLQRPQNLNFLEILVIILHLLEPTRDGKRLKENMVVMITAGKISSQFSQWKQLILLGRNFFLC